MNPQIVIQPETPIAKTQHIPSPQKEHSLLEPTALPTKEPPHQDQPNKVDLNPIDVSREAESKEKRLEAVLEVKLTRFDTIEDITTLLVSTKCIPPPSWTTVLIQPRTIARFLQIISSVGGLACLLSHNFSSPWPCALNNASGSDLYTFVAITSLVIFLM